MRVLIDNVAVFALSDKDFIERGYIYVDKGAIVAVGEGSPPPELEFADYVINGNYFVVLPGFVVGIGNIVDYMFRFRRFADRKPDIIATLSLNDIESLSATALATLALNGATAIATYVSPLSYKLLTGLAIASSECWIRLRVIIPIGGLDIYTVEDMVKSAMKSIKDSEAISKGIVSFGLYADRDLNKDIVEVARSLNAKLYVDGSLTRSESFRSIAKEATAIVQQNSLADVSADRIVIANAELWRRGMGLVSFNPLDLNPRIFISTISKVLKSPVDVLGILCHYNPLNIDLGARSIEVGGLADIIVLDYSKPPTGPMPISREDIAVELSLANYAVETVLVAGELTIDQGLTLNIGEKHVRRAQSVLDSLRSR